MADALARDAARLLAANAEDMAAARAHGLEPALLDRLSLNEKTVAAMAEGLRQIAALPDPVGEMDDLKFRPPASRSARCACRSGSSASFTKPAPTSRRRRRPVPEIRQRGDPARRFRSAPVQPGHRRLRARGLAAAGLPETAVQVIETSDRAAVGELITMKDYVDVIVPRGGKGLIERISGEARVPVIKHLHGNCHVYLDDRADLAKAVKIVENAKTQRYGTCNTTNPCWLRAQWPPPRCPASAPCSPATAWKCAAARKP